MFVPTAFAWLVQGVKYAVRRAVFADHCIEAMRLTEVAIVSYFQEVSSMCALSLLRSSRATPPDYV